MNYTSNMGMNMPDENDKFSIEHFNTNTQALDIVGKPDEYKNTKTYAVGDLCIHNNILYKCIIAVETAEEFNAEKWEVTSLCKEEIANKTAIAELNENITFPDGTGFYPDEQDGQKGYNTSPNRGADTFFPFNNLSNLVNVYSHSGANYVYTAEKSGYAIYTAFNGSEPTIENISGKAKKIKYDNKSTSHGTEQLYIAYLLAGDKITAKAATGWSLLFV